MEPATPMEAVTTALTTGLTSIATAATGAIGDIVPVAAPVLGAILIIGIGIKAFKKISGRNG